ncbi:sensor histidine kinase [Actinospica durhamensis]|uniref:histidine kinase n=1 Tax=Actinospica durhamensis TaxID=1508375 RepID=A0A941INJ8_9ACTN|nr:sensor histidine kinase [Actinospica durhamensis]MBR7832107.1 sensor histidine kinase [Actinospica durhamensis]
MRRGRMRKLSSQIFVGQVAILVATVLVGFVLFAHEERAQLDQQYEQQAVSIAESVASIDQIGLCLEPGARPCGDEVQQIAEHVMRDTGAGYVVVIDMNRVRHSHPDSALIGKQVEEPIVTKDGLPRTGIDDGVVGRSASGKAPLYAPDGTMVGEVSVGILESRVSTALWSVLPVYALWFAVALVIGAFASWLLARRLKRRTFGLELDEIAKLLLEREAVLHAIREGMIAFDRAGRITLVNDEARRLLSIESTAIGSWIEEVVAPGRLRDVLSGTIGGKDEVVLTDEYCLTVNRMPVALAGRPHGSVVTLRDRTELAGLLRELDSVRGLTDALRAQQHEFSNRMHTVAGLLELGESDEALCYLTDLGGAQAEFAESLRSRIASPLIVGLILAKAAVAAERGIELVVSEESWAGEVPATSQALTTILGNLIDNALDAVGGTRREDGPGRVTVLLVEEGDRLRVEVADNGPGIAAQDLGSVFLDGFSTKPASGSLRRGLGLALVHRLVQRLGGTIEASTGPGAVFTVSLPAEVSAIV